MDSSPASRNFLEPEETSQRHYEALRAIFVAGEPLGRVAERFGYKISALKSMASRFRSAFPRGVGPPLFPPPAAGGPPPGGAPPFSPPAGGGRPRGRAAGGARPSREPTEVADARQMDLAPGRA